MRSMDRSFLAGQSSIGGRACSSPSTDHEGRPGPSPSFGTLATLTEAGLSFDAALDQILGAYTRPRPLVQELQTIIGSYN